MMNEQRGDQRVDQLTRDLRSLAAKKVIGPAVRR